MADIKEIDYEEMAKKAAEIAGKTDEMQNYIKNAFSKIDNMRSGWYGQSYDNFVSTVNLSIKGLNTIFETTVSSIPNEIVAKAKSYSLATQGQPISYEPKVAIILSEITKTNKGTKYKFESGKVLADKNQIKEYFEKAKGKADEAMSIVNGSLKNAWQSVSGESNITEMKAALLKVKVILGTLWTSLETQISEQEKTIDTIETAAKASEAIKNVKDDLVDAANDAANSAIDTITNAAASVWNKLT